MIDGKKIVVVVPAGRRRYMEVQFKHILRDRDVVDEYRIWVNTKDEADIAYFRNLREAHPDFVTLDERFMNEAAVGGNGNIHRFFTACRDPETIYVRLDDDVVYVHPGSIKNLVEKRLKHVEPFLIYGNIVNNGIMTHLHQRTSAMKPVKGRLAGYSCSDDLGWKDPHHASEVHKNFFERFKRGTLDAYFMSDWHLWSYERVSINCIAWAGSDFLNNDIVVGGPDEEQWLSVTAPQRHGRPNMIAGDTLFCHYAFYKQRPRLEADPAILQRYAEIASKIVPFDG